MKETASYLLRLSQVSLLFQLVASLKHFVPALNGRLCELLALTQFLNYANITVLTLVALQRPVNRLSFFCTNYKIEGENILPVW